MKKDHSKADCTDLSESEIVTKLLQLRLTTKCATRM